MKYNKAVSSSRRVARRRHFNSSSTERRKIMSESLSKALRSEYNVRAMPIRRDDEVRVVRGTYKQREGKVVACYRRKFVIHIEKVTREKANGQVVQVGVHPS